MMHFNGIQNNALIVELAIDRENAKQQAAAVIDVVPIIL